MTPDLGGNAKFSVHQLMKSHLVPGGRSPRRENCPELPGLLAVSHRSNQLPPDVGCLRNRNVPGEISQGHRLVAGSHSAILSAIRDLIVLRRSDQLREHGSALRAEDP